MRKHLLKRYIAQAYPAVGKIRDIRPLPHVNINSENFLVEASRGKFVLKHDRVIPPARLENTVRVLAFCKEKKTKVIAPMKTKAGRYTGKGRFLLFHFAQGKPFSRSLKETLALARELARLHKALSSCPVFFPAKRVNARLYKPLSPRELKRMKRIPSFDTLLAASTLLATHKLLLGRRQLIHGDLQPGNVLFEKGRVAAMLDFGGMHQENIWREVAFAAFRFALASSPKETIRTDVLRFARAYAHERGLRAPSFEELRLHFVAETFARASYILRQQKETRRSAWARDLPKQISFLKRALAVR